MCLDNMVSLLGNTTRHDLKQNEGPVLLPRHPNKSKRSLLILLFRVVIRDMMLLDDHTGINRYYCDKSQQRQSCSQSMIEVSSMPIQF